MKSVNERRNWVKKGKMLGEYYDILGKNLLLEGMGNHCIVLRKEEAIETFFKSVPFNSVDIAASRIKAEMQILWSHRRPI